MPETMPPEMMEETEAPPVEGSPAGAAAAMSDQQKAATEAALAARPTPSEPYKAATVKALADALNSVIEAVEGDDSAPFKVEGTGTVPTIPDPLWIAAFALVELLKQVKNGEHYAKYEFDLGGASTDSGLRLLASQIAAVAKNKACIRDIQAAFGGGDAKDGAKPATEPADSSAAPPDELVANM